MWCFRTRSIVQGPLAGYTGTRLVTGCGAVTRRATRMTRLSRRRSLPNRCTRDEGLALSTMICLNCDYPLVDDSQYAVLFATSFTFPARHHRGGLRGAGEPEDCQPGAQVPGTAVTVLGQRLRQSLRKRLSLRQSLSLMPIA